METLPSVLVLTLGKLGKLCRVFSVVHSAKSTSPLNPVNFFLPRVYFCRVFTDSRQTVCRVPDEKHSANYCLPTNQCRVLYAECNTRQSICRVFLSVCRVPLTLGKSTVSRSAHRIRPALGLGPLSLYGLWLYISEISYHDAAADFGI